MKQHKHGMVPVIEIDGKAAMPCSGARARLLMKQGEAKAYWQKGIFCIKLLKKASSDGRQDIALGIDPGSKREGYTVATTKGVVLNITSNTPDWVKEHVETRRNLRRSRRRRKTPYRACRGNRAALRKEGRIPPSTKARWEAKLRIAKQLLKIIPITLINVEDIKVASKEDKPAWNKSFSPLEVGKTWFYAELEKLGMRLIKTEGFDTKKHRDKRGFEKSKAKLDYAWEAHNVDSHSLVEMTLKTEMAPYKGVWKLEFMQFHRRRLHVQNAAKGGKRRVYGGTISLGISRGSMLIYRDKLCYLGGTSKGKVSLHSVITSKRAKRHVSIGDIKVMHTNKWRMQFLPRLKPWGSLCEFS